MPTGKENLQPFSVSDTARTSNLNGQMQPQVHQSIQPPQQQQQNRRPLILITDSNSTQSRFTRDDSDTNTLTSSESYALDHQHPNQPSSNQQPTPVAGGPKRSKAATAAAAAAAAAVEEDRFEEVDGISYRIVAAVTKPARPPAPPAIFETNDETASNCDEELGQTANEEDEFRSARGKSLRRTESTKARLPLSRTASAGTGGSKFTSMRRKSSAFVSNLLQAVSTASAASHSAHELDAPRRRLSIYEMTKTPPPETSIEIYLSERRRSSTVSSKQAQAQIQEQQSTFETNYCQRQQYFKDLNRKLLNQDRKLLNVVANRGQIHRHSVDIAQLPLGMALAKAKSASFRQRRKRAGDPSEPLAADEGEAADGVEEENEEEEEEEQLGAQGEEGAKSHDLNGLLPESELEKGDLAHSQSRSKQLAAISEDFAGPLTGKFGVLWCWRVGVGS